MCLLQAVYISGYEFEGIVFLLHFKNSATTVESFHQLSKSLAPEIRRHRIGYEKAYEYTVLYYNFFKTQPSAQTPYAYNLEQCIEMAQIGADVIVCHAGLTMKGLTAAKIAPPLDRCVEMLTEWCDAIHRENPDTIILCHGGPIAEPEDYAYVHKYVPKLAGFYGASSIERIPVETDVMHTVREYKSLSLLSSGARGSSTGGGNRAV